MRALYNQNKFTMAQLAKRFGVSVTLTYFALRGKRWTKAKGNTKKIRVCKKVTDKSKQDIQRRYQRGEKATALAKAYGVTASRIVQIGKHGF